METLESLDTYATPPTADEKNLALLSHMGTFFGGFIVPLIVWLVKKDESAYVARHAKESLNFQISLIIYFVASAILMFIVVGVFLIFALSIFSLIVVILATVAASQGKDYQYPLCIRFIN
ncbi:MAG: DUF4870 domain-containing protein [Flavobacteriales bacterium]